jgi:hypothetical protein
MRKLFLAIAVLALCSAAQAAPALYGLTVDDGKLGGPGADVIRGELPGSQFILYGEDHGFADSRSCCARSRTRRGRSVSSTTSSKSARCRRG